jgi:class 3 adenylate cyclase/tetratricopeptide (TPR) repeat protein
MVPAPTQTVSMLVTDLVGSTAMADRIGPVAAEQLRTEHFGLLRDALERTGGREVKNLGDGLMTVFDSASQSLLCAVEMQQAVETRNRHAEEPFRVRIGVSLGDATVEEGDYFGPPAVEASRLCAEAAGGQIVVNALVRQVAGGREADRFRSLGGLELKGISEPLQAFELEWEPLLSPGIALPERLRDLPATGYVGRVAERERLTELWEEARKGALQLALVSGEAGVGKTRLAAQLALQVRGEGATVLYGRCDEDLGVPYQPWVQALGYLVQEAPQRVLQAHVERFGADLARLIPGLRDRVAALPPGRESDPETERYLLYASIVGLLEGASEREPLLMILDDLHWADKPTLSLLRHVVTANSSVRAIVMGTYRDSDLSRDHSLTALLADLHRDEGGERMKLTGLESEDVLALMEADTGHELDEDGRALAAEIARETAGNPFFAGELLRHLTESGTIVQEADGRSRLVGDLSQLGLPQSVREVIGRRVERLGTEARTALSAAAVIGRDFDLDLLVAVVEFPEARLLDLLDEAVAASLLSESAERAGRFTFTHALVEHALYEDLGRARRARLHKQVAEALEQLCGDDPGERLGELARHWAAAVASTDTAKAMHYARRAAERALQQLAPDEAARWYRQALELYEQAPGGDRAERCELLIGLGEAQRQTGSVEHRQTLLDAAALARELGDGDRLCRAVLANNRGWSSQVGVVDSERVKALEAAAESLPSRDARRAQVLALLASELLYSGDPGRCRRLAAEAVDIARSAGDARAFANTLHNACWGIWVPDMTQERRRLTDELVAIADRLNDPVLSFSAAAREWELATEMGDRSKARAAVTTMRLVTAAIPQPSFEWACLLWECVWELIQGDLAASERTAMLAFEVASTSGEPDAALFLGGQLLNIRSLQGRSGELVEQVTQFARGPDSLPAWRSAAATSLLECGRDGEALELALAEDFQRVPWDPIWLVTLFGWSDACSRLGLADRAGELYDLLAPYPDRFAVSGSLAYGSIAWALGRLAATMARYTQADEHFATAVEIEERLGAPLFLARTHASRAAALIASGRPEDLERAEPMLAQAEEVAAALGAEGTVRDVAQSRSALAAIGSPNR